MCKIVINEKNKEARGRKKTNQKIKEIIKQY